MKTLILIFISTTLLLASKANAQVTVNVNVGTPPLWGPVGYTDVRYYYLPDVEAYYDIQSSMFIYYGSGVWIRRAYLPTHYQTYDLYNGYKVVMTDYRGNSPYIYYKSHKVKYAKGYRGNPQKTIGHKPGNGNNKSHGNYKSQPNKGNGQHKTGGNGNGKGGGKGKKK